MKGRVTGSRWVENLLRPVLIAAMLVCLAAPFARTLEWLMPGWDSTYLLVFAFFAGLEGILSERALRKRGITGWQYLLSRVAEALILLLLLKLVNYIALGLDQLVADALTWFSNPKGFFTIEDSLTGLLFLVLWAGALYVARQASELDLDESPACPPPDKTSTEYYLWLTQPPPVRHRQEALDWLGETFVWGGIAILLSSAMIHFLMPTAQVPALPTLLYFALGVALLSQARFGVSHAAWRAQGIPIQPGIGRRWLFWAIIFLVGVALVARLLPTEYTMGPVLALFRLIGIIAQVMMIIITLIMYLLAILLSFVMPNMERPSRPPLGLEAVPLAEQATGAAWQAWLEVVLSVLFWAVILVIVGYAFHRFVRDRFGLLAEEEGAEQTWWGRFLVWLRDLWRQWRTWRHEAQDRLARRRAGRKKASIAATLSRFLSLRRLPPRELVRYFYLSAAKRAAQAGQPRRPGQTPYEYQATLDGRFPDLEPDLTGLTDAFVQARYSHQPVHKEDAQAAKPLWQRIKAALRRRRVGA